MKFVRAVFCFASAGLFGACSTVNDQIADIVFIPNPNSDRRTEAVNLELAYSANEPCVAPESKAQTTAAVCEFLGAERSDEKAFMSATFGADALQLARSALKRALADEAKRYTATFAASASGAQFYHHRFATKIAAAEPAFATGHLDEGAYRSATDVKLAGFKFTRVIEPEDDGAVAMRICAIVLPSIYDSFVSVIPVSYDYRYSKAKLIGFNLLSPLGVDILNPWEAVTDPLAGRGFDLPPADRDVDVSLKIWFEHMYYAGEGLKVESTNEEEFKLPAVSIAGKSMPRYFPGYAKFLEELGKNGSGADVQRFELPCDDAVTPPSIAALRDRILKDIPLDNAARMQLEAAAKPFPSARRSFGSSGSGPDKRRRGNANFTLHVMATETDDYGAHIAEINEKFEVDEQKSEKSASSLWKSVSKLWDVD